MSVKRGKSLPGARSAASAANDNLMEKQRSEEDVTEKRKKSRKSEKKRKKSSEREVDVQETALVAKTSRPILAVQSQMSEPAESLPGVITASNDATGGNAVSVFSIEAEHAEVEAIYRNDNEKKLLRQLAESECERLDLLDQVDMLHERLSDMMSCNESRDDVKLSEETLIIKDQCIRQLQDEKKTFEEEVNKLKAKHKKKLKALGRQTGEEKQVANIKMFELQTTVEALSEENTILEEKLMRATSSQNSESNAASSRTSTENDAFNPSKNVIMQLSEQLGDLEDTVVVLETQIKEKDSVIERLNKSHKGSKTNSTRELEERNRSLEELIQEKDAIIEDLSKVAKAQERKPIKKRSADVSVTPRGSSSISRDSGVDLSARPGSSSISRDSGLDLSARPGSSLSLQSYHSLSPGKRSSASLISSPRSFSAGNRVKTNVSYKMRNGGDNNSISNVDMGFCDIVDEDEVGFVNVTREIENPDAEFEGSAIHTAGLVDEDKDFDLKEFALDYTLSSDYLADKYKAKERRMLSRMSLDETKDVNNEVFATYSLHEIAPKKSNFVSLETL